MYKTHTCGDGTTLLICCMEDDHLLNTINLLCRKIKECVAILKDETRDDPVLRAFQPTFSRERLVKEATKNLTFYHDKLEPYVMEACLRGLHTAMPLREAYGRGVKVQMASTALNTRQLRAMEDYDSEDDPDFDPYESYMLDDEDVLF